MKGGIYKITNLINNKIYVGSTNNFTYRKYSHKNKKNNTVISRAIHKYGWDNFTFDILEYCDSKFLAIRENYYFDLLQPFIDNNGYNILRTATDNGWLGHTHTEETKRKMSESRMGLVPWNKGKTGLQKMCKEEKLLRSKKYTGEGNPFYGKTHTKETKKKLSDHAKMRDMSCYNKQVVQIDKITLEEIKIWDSISDASEEIFNDRKNSAITAVCKGRIKSAGGFYWKYKDKDI